MTTTTTDFSPAEVVADLDFGDWSIEVHTEPVGGGWYLQVWFEADGAEQHGRKWRLSPFMTKSEVVQTAFAAVLAAVEHETREHFLYRGQAIFGPHFDVDALWGIARCQLHDVRQPA